VSPLSVLATEEHETRPSVASLAGAGPSVVGDSDVGLRRGGLAWTSPTDVDVLGEGERWEGVLSRITNP